MSCSITNGPVILTNQNLTCDEITYSYASSFTVRGSSANNFVDISNTNAVIQFSNVSIFGGTAVTIAQSTVTLLIEGINVLIADEGETVSIECVSGSNITIKAIELGHLSVTGGYAGPGVGSGLNEYCASITIANGSVESEGGTGIGSGWVNESGTSRLGTLFIYDGDIQAIAIGDGAGMGSGNGNFGGTSIIDNLVILNGSITAIGHWCGIGSGSVRPPFSALASATSEIGNLAIFNGLSTASSQIGAGIGAGHAPDGASKIGNLVIVNGNITAYSGIGPGIGTGTHNSAVNVPPMIKDPVHQSGPDAMLIGIGDADGERVSWIGNLTICNGNIIAQSNSGSPAIGAGEGNSWITTLTIWDGTITTTSQSGPGNGTVGCYDPFLSRTDNLTIFNGTITTNNDGSAPAIGIYGSYSWIGSLTIWDGVITATSNCGPGIGTAEGEIEPSTIENLTIFNGVIIATSIDSGPGIGSGQGFLMLRTLTIWDGTITATAADGSGIGTASGSYDAAMAHIENLTIFNGNITASSEASSSGIGTGFGSSSITHLTILDGTITARSTYGSGIGAASLPFIWRNLIPISRLTL